MLTPTPPDLVDHDSTIHPDLLIAAAHGRLETVVIVGIDHDGQPYIATSHTDAEAVHLLMKAINALSSDWHMAG